MIVTYPSGDVLETRFDIGDIVYLVTDPEQRERIVTIVQIYSSNFAYHVALGDETSFHYEFELSEERDLSKAMGVGVSQ